MSIRYFVEPLALRDRRGEAIALWRANLRGFTADSADAKFESGYCANPAGSGTLLGLRVDGGSALVGVQGVHPRTMHLGPVLVRAANLADFAVAREHRTLGPALLLIKQALTTAASSVDLLYGLPNAKSAAVCTRAGLRRIGAMQRHAKPLRTERLLGRHLPAALACLLAPLADLGFRLVDVWRRLHTKPALICHDKPWDGNDVDAIWERRSPALLLSERSSAMLRWRFRAAGSGNWQLSILTQKDRQAVGHVVWHLVDGVATVGDFFCIDPGTQTTALMLAFAEHARKQGAAVVTVLFFGMARVSDGLRSAGFTIRSEEDMVFVGHTAPAIAALDPDSAWYCTAFDNDAS